ISWMKRDEKNNLKLLTYGLVTYSSDARQSLHFESPNDWQLRLTAVQRSDAGSYQCQMSTHPPRILHYTLNVARINKTQARQVKKREQRRNYNDAILFAISDSEFCWQNGRRRMGKAHQLNDGDRLNCVSKENGFTSGFYGFQGGCFEAILFCMFTSSFPPFYPSKSFPGRSKSRFLSVLRITFKVLRHFETASKFWESSYCSNVAIIIIFPPPTCINADNISNNTCVTSGGENVAFRSTPVAQQDSQRSPLWTNKKVRNAHIQVSFCTTFEWKTE
ncbi:hypothetical protein Ocin01_15165, partial [Orchesella cincta]